MPDPIRTPFRLPWLPPAYTVIVPGRGEFFVRHHQHRDPDAPLVVLLHGWTASADIQFVTAYPALAEHCSFIGIDHRGHGRGLRTDEAFTLEDAADDMALVLRHLGLRSAITVGYSMGGPIAMLLARRHPDLVAGLVVQATALEWSVKLTDRIKWWLLPLFGSVLRSRGSKFALRHLLPWSCTWTMSSARTCRGCSANSSAAHPMASSRPVGRSGTTTLVRGRRRSISRPLSSSPRKTGW